MRSFHSEGYVKWVRMQECVECGGWPSEVAHTRSRGAGGTWQDTIPLCPTCHRRQHDQGWSSLSIDREAEAAKLRERWEARNAQQDLA